VTYKNCYPTYRWQFKFIEFTAIIHHSIEKLKYCCEVKGKYILLVVESNSVPTKTKKVIFKYVLLDTELLQPCNKCSSHLRPFRSENFNHCNTDGLTFVYTSIGFHNSVDHKTLRESYGWCLLITVLHLLIVKICQIQNSMYTYTALNGCRSLVLNFKYIFFIM
jgi:hypothetical protein